jgi:C-terminal processing protease CtpA/Prc
MSRRMLASTAIGVVLSLAPASFRLFSAQEKMDSISLDRARGILRDAHEMVKKNYYDPKFHGLDWDALYREYDEKIKSAGSLSQGLGVVAAYLDRLNDSHTFLRPPSRPYRLDYGFRMAIYGDYCFITRVRPGTDAVEKVTQGDQVLGYNNVAVNRADFRKIEYYYNSLAPQKSSILVLRDPTGKERKVSIDAKMRELKKVMDLTGSSSDTDLWEIIREGETFDHLVRQRYVEMGDVMVWKMPEFDLEDGEVDRLFGTARKHRALVLDVRENPGGRVTTLERIVGNIFDHDVKIADRTGRKLLKPDVGKTRGGNAYSGKLIVLVDSSSASAAELFARVVQLEKRGTVIGDHSSGHVMESRYYRASQGLDTKIFYGFSITEADLIMADGKSLEHTGVTPDETLLPNAQDLASGRDPVLARAIELAGIKIDPAQAGKMFPFEWLPN